MFANFDYPVADDLFRSAVEAEARTVLDRVPGRRARRVVRQQRGRAAGDDARPPCRRGAPRAVRRAPSPPRTRGRDRTSPYVPSAPSEASFRSSRASGVATTTASAATDGRSTTSGAPAFASPPSVLRSPTCPMTTPSRASACRQTQAPTGRSRMFVTTTHASCTATTRRRARRSLARRRARSWPRCSASGGATRRRAAAGSCCGSPICGRARAGACWTTEDGRRPRITTSAGRSRRSRSGSPTKAKAGSTSTWPTIGRPICRGASTWPCTATEAQGRGGRSRRRRRRAHRRSLGRRGAARALRRCVVRISIRPAGLRRRGRDARPRR